MRIIIDGDGCPVVKQAVHLAKSHHVECIIFCDTCHQIHQDYATIIMVDKGADSVDFALVNRLEEGDIVITQDYGLAAMCLSRKAQALHQDGMIYSADNIDALLLARQTAQKIRRGGGRLKGSGKRTQGQDRKFVEVLEEMLQRKHGN